MRLHYRLLLSNLFCVALLALVAGLFLKSGALMRELTETQIKSTETSAALRDGLLQCRDDVEDESTYEALNAVHDQIVALTSGTRLGDSYLKVWPHVETVRQRKERNESIAAEVFQLADVSVETANGYIEQVAQKLADEQTRSEVSTLERLVIIGANLNTPTRAELAFTSDIESLLQR